MKTIMLKIQIILTIIIVVGVYLHVKKQNDGGGVSFAALDPMAPSVHVESKDTFDILKANLEAGDDATPEQIAGKLFQEAMQSPGAPKNVSNQKQSEMMERAKAQAQRMMETGDVSAYRREIDKNTVLQKIIGE